MTVELTKEQRLVVETAWDTWNRSPAELTQYDNWLREAFDAGVRAMLEAVGDEECERRLAEAQAALANIEEWLESFSSGVRQNFDFVRDGKRAKADRKWRHGAHFDTCECMQCQIEAGLHPGLDEGESRGEDSDSMEGSCPCHDESVCPDGSE